jgi:hypothetical protein
MEIKTTERIQIEYRLNSHKDIKWVKVDDIRKEIGKCISMPNKNQAIGRLQKLIFKKLSQSDIIQDSINKQCNNLVKENNTFSDDDINKYVKRLS